MEDPQHHPAAAPEVIGDRYELGEPIGEGTFAVTLRAHDTSTAKGTGNSAGRWPSPAGIPKELGMDASRFDRLARGLAAGRDSRRRLLARAGGAFVVGLGLVSPPVAAQEDKDKDKGNGPACRGEGHPCEGNQTCCAGLTCVPSGPGAADRCTAGTTAECAGDCPATEQVVMVVDVDIDVEADCAYSGETKRTTCTFTAAASEGAVASVAVPESLLCAEVVGGDYDEVDLGANARPKGKAKGLKSKKTEDGRAVVTLELVGEVTVAATATYWCETDGAVLFPVTGPGLSCAEAEAPLADDVSDSTGAVVVQTYACDVAADAPAIDWFAACGAPTAAATFRLSRPDGEDWVEVATEPTDAEGLCRFGQRPPGTYRLEQTEGAWCHAESDSVDERGDVVVQAGARATVWVFHCAAAK